MWYMDNKCAFEILMSRFQFLNFSSVLWKVFNVMWFLTLIVAALQNFVGCCMNINGATKVKFCATSQKVCCLLLKSISVQPGKVFLCSVGKSISEWEEKPLRPNLMAARCRFASLKILKKEVRIISTEDNEMKWMIIFFFLFIFINR